ncbi:MAG TPA: hypothetical protein VL094_13160 [Sphingomonadaceae bacterium]|nr:hypothetical protein [Sphingomonadaceae bacterium]
MRRIVGIAAGMVLALASVPALACSVQDDYRVPTNLELAGKADLILLAKVTGGTEGAAQGPEDFAITIDPLVAIKGELPAGPLTLQGVTLSEPRFLALSNPYDFAQAHPLSYIGGCIRYMFPLGTTALFFLQQGEDGAWEPLVSAFSRWAEDVPGPDAPWVKLSALYAEASALPEAERKARLEQARQEWAGMAADPVAQLMAADVARQLAGPNETWNALMRREMRRLGFGDENESGEGQAVDTTLEQMRGTDSKP